MRFAHIKQMKQILNSLVIAFIFGFHLLAIAEDGSDAFMPAYFSSQLFTEMYDKAIETHHKFSQQKLSSNEKQICDMAYLKMFDSPEFKISVFFGYGDISSKHERTSDRIERYLFVTGLTQPCRPGIALCEFHKVNGSSYSYQRLIQTRNGQSVLVSIRVLTASLTDQVEFNEQQFRNEQIQRSKKMEQLFLQSMQQDDVVIYSGHSRHGTGVGMRPLKENSSDWYKAAIMRPMFYKMTKTLKDEKQPKLLGLISCDSELHYGKVISENAPNTAILLTRNTLSAADAVRLLFNGLNSLLMQNCEAEFQTHLNQSIHSLYYYTRLGPPKDYNKKMPKIFNLFNPEEVTTSADIIQAYDDLKSEERIIDLNKKHAEF